MAFVILRDYVVELQEKLVSAPKKKKNLASLRDQYVEYLNMTSWDTVKNTRHVFAF